MGGRDPQCTFWNPQLDGEWTVCCGMYVLSAELVMCVCTLINYTILDGYGDWSSEGCMISESYEENDTEVICHCTHLTSFTILLVNSSLS